MAIYMHRTWSNFLLRIIPFDQISEGPRELSEVIGEKTLDLGKRKWNDPSNLSLPFCPVTLGCPLVHKVRRRILESLILLQKGANSFTYSTNV